MTWIKNYLQNASKFFKSKTEAEVTDFKRKEGLARLWFICSFLFVMLLVTIIFEIPFLTFVPRAKNVTSTQNGSEEVAVKKTVIMRVIMAESLDLLSSEDNSGRFPMIQRLKFFFICGLISGGLCLGPVVELLGRKSAFKVLSRTLILFVLLMSISGHFLTAGLCWFVIGFCLLSNYHMLNINAFEKFSDLYESPEDLNSDAQFSEKFKKYKYRLFLMLGFGFVWNFGRLIALLLSWLTQDWILILMWLGIVIMSFYFIFGDFMAENIVDDDISQTEKDLEDEDCKDENFYTALRNHPILALNIFILGFNWFAACHNLFALMLGWTRLSSNFNMFDNSAVHAGMSFLSQPIKFGICLSVKRKILPLSITTFFSGICIFIMIIFNNEETSVNKTTLSSGKLFAAHVASVLLSVGLGILTPVTYETFPKKFRMHASGFCSACGRFGILIGTILNQLGYFKSEFGPAFGGTLSVIAAILSRLLPDMTTSRMPKTQWEIEKQQFPNSAIHQPENTLTTLENVKSTKLNDHIK